MKQKIMRRALAVCLTLVLLVSAIPMVFAATAASGSIGSVKWNLDSNGTLTISGTGEMPGKSLWSSPDKVSWNEYAADVTAITLENGVTTIGSYAFAGFKSIRTITIPKSIKSIGFAAFEGCSNLRTVTLSEGLETIEDRAFNKCTRLSEVVIPKSVVAIGALAFNDIEYLRDITILNPACVIDESDGEGKTIDRRATITGYAGSTAETFSKNYHRAFTAISEEDADSLSLIMRIRQFFASLIPTLVAGFARFMEATGEVFGGNSNATIPGASPAENTFANLIPYVESLLRSLIPMLQGATA